MQVYDAMAEKPKDDGQESVTGSVKTDEKNTDAQSPIKSVNGANHEAKGSGVEECPVPPVDEVINTKPATNEEPSEKDVKSDEEAEQEDEGAEGSKLYKFRALFVNGSWDVGTQYRVFL